MRVQKLKAATNGSGNIGADLMIKIMRHAKHLELAAMVGQCGYREELFMFERPNTIGRTMERW